MKLFYVFAVALILLSGIAAKVILQPIQPPGAAKITVVPISKKQVQLPQVSWVQGKMENRCCTKCI
jgi:hypothetical protein